MLQTGASGGSGTISFLSQLYSSAGPCVHCDHRECAVRGIARSLQEYAASVLVRSESGAVRCGERGLQVQNYDVSTTKVMGEGGLQPQPWKKEEPTLPSSTSSTSSEATSPPSPSPKEEMVGLAPSLQPTLLLIILLLAGNTHL